MTPLSRRSLFSGALGAAAAANASTPDVAAVLQINDLDRRIWAEELEEFVPKKMWDMHSHLGLARYDLDPNRARTHAAALNGATLEAASTMEVYQQCNRLLYPGRQVVPLVLPMPHMQCACVEQNGWAADETRTVPGAACTMVVKPDMPAALVDAQIRKHRFIGFKPYMWYAPVKKWTESRITDYLTEPHLEVANQYGLIMAVHLSKSLAISDPDNLNDLDRLTKKYPRVRWLLLHNARSYSAWAMEKAAPRLREIPNLWFESSSVCEADAFYATFSLLGTERFCYGTDDVPVGITRGKYIAWGYGWEQLDEVNFTGKVKHCDGRFTFVRFEMLRALKRAAKYVGLSRAQVENIFFHNGERLVAAARADLEKTLG